MNFKKNDYVIVNPEIVESKEWIFPGSGGRIERIYKNRYINVIWDSITLQQITNDYLKWLNENEYYAFDYTFAENELIVAEPRDTIEEVYLTQEKVYNHIQKLFDKKKSLIEDWYDRFKLTPYYSQLTDIQKDKSWFIISVFSEIMEKKHGFKPTEWEIEAFKEVYTLDMHANVIGSSRLYKSYKNVMMQFLKFMQLKMKVNTEELQSCLVDIKIRQKS